MLAFGTLGVAITACATLPTIFHWSRLRSAHGWRSRAIDEDWMLYNPPTPSESNNMWHVARKERANDDSLSVPPAEVSHRENLGIYFHENVFSADECDYLLSEVRGLVQEYGHHWVESDVEFWGQRLRQLRDKSGGGGVASSSSSSSSPSMDLETPKRMLWASSILEEKTADPDRLFPWGSGDKIRHQMIPSSLRHAVHRIQDEYKNLGDLRNIAVIYSSNGELLRSPQAPVRWCGNDYVMLPLRPSKKTAPSSGGASNARKWHQLVTFSPLLRSRFSDVFDIASQSWSSHDIDVLMPTGSLVKVSSKARFQWGYSFRPGPAWCGHPENLLPRNNAVEGEKQSTGSSSGKGWFGVGKKKEAIPQQPSSTEGNEERDAAVLILGFEGPYYTNSPRRKISMPEYYGYGTPPTMEKFQGWDGALPTEAEISSEGPMWFVKNFTRFLAA